MNDDLQLQSPAETLDYPIDWSDALVADTISASDWAILPAGPQITGKDVGGDPPQSTLCFLAGVSLGVVYRLTNTIQTAGGRTWSRSFTIRGWAE